VTAQVTENNGGLSSSRGRTVRSPSLKNKQKTHKNGHTSTVSGELSTTWCRTVCRQTPRKHTETNRFWILCSRQRRTVRTVTSDCPPVKEQKSHSETAALDLLSPDPQTVRGYTANCHRIAEKQEQSTPQNRHLPSIFRFAAKSSPTATKLGKHDHKAVGELPLKGHRPI
jgi:hypothetical protein